MSSDLRQLGLAFGIVFLSFLFVLGSMLVSFSEGRQLAVLFPSPTATLLPSFTPLPTQAPGTLLSAAQPSLTPTPTITGTFTPTPTPACPKPADWSPITVQPGDTLESLAAAYATSVDILIHNNCLVSAQILPGVVLYVPNASPTMTLTPTSTHLPATATPCPPPPAGWVLYVIQPLDTLYSLALKFGVTAYQLQTANCLPNANIINAGHTLYVPNVPTKTPLPPTATRTAPVYTPTDTPTFTDTPQPTDTPTDTPVPTDTDTPTPEPTFTESPYPAP